MTDRELLQEVLATYLVFRDFTPYVELDSLFQLYLSIYLKRSNQKDEEYGWNYLNKVLRNPERRTFYAQLKHIYLKG